jgi:hypothetical protein
MIDEEFYPVITNRQTRKIEMLAETKYIGELTNLINRIPSARDKLKEITLNDSPNMSNAVEKFFSEAI